jgi:hypothetical protein
MTAAAPVEKRVDTLRRAAEKVRALADAASLGPWEAVVLGSEGYDVRGPAAPGQHRLRRTRVARCGYEQWEIDKANAKYIASWHPDVARSVADMLEEFARLDDQGIHPPTHRCGHPRQALPRRRVMNGLDLEYLARTNA